MPTDAFSQHDSPARAPAFAFTTHPSVAKFATPMKQDLDANPQFDAIIVGAHVYDRAGRLLLLQRAAHDSMPLRWEVPGGACDLEDETILHGVARELWEESGLTPRRMSRLIKCRAQDGMVFVSRRQRIICKYSFEVDVEQGHDVKLDPDEHQAFVWATEDECRARKVGELEIPFTTKEQEELIQEGFKLRNEGLERGDRPENDATSSGL